MKNKVEHFSPVPFSQRKKSPSVPRKPETPVKRTEFRSQVEIQEEETMPNYEDFQSLMQDVDTIVSDGDKSGGSRQNNDRRNDIEYQSIQDTLKKIKELKSSPYSRRRNKKTLRSEQEMELNYSLTSDNFSRDENPMEDASAIFNSAEKYDADDTISMLTYKSPGRDTLRSSWKRSSQANGFLVFKDKSILELLKVYEKGKSSSNKSADVANSIEKIDYLFNRLRYLNSKNRV